ncbi:MAG: hypothetical protein Q7S43_04205 [bacterium]|nr:hypothetical protein [bacterium]
MKKLDWKALGKFISVLLGFFTIIRETFAKMGVGIEIVEWLIGDGRKVFIEEFLSPLGKKFLATQRWKMVNATTIMVNLGVLPRLLFDAAIIEWHRGEGWVRVQKRKDGLYVNGCKVILYLSEHQKDGKIIKDHELRDELTGKSVLNANLLDALYENTHLIPEDWKKDTAGKICCLSTSGIADFATRALAASSSAFCASATVRGTGAAFGSAATGAVAIPRLCSQVSPKFLGH